MNFPALPLMLDGIASLVGIRSGRLTALIFHRVLAEDDPLLPGEMHAQLFDKLLGTLVRYFNVLPVSEALELRQRGKLPPRSLVITFDDGYADNFTVACPILRRHGLQATFFIASGYLNGGVMFNDKVIEVVRRTSLDEVDLSWIDMGHCSLSSLEQRRMVIDGLLLKIKYLSLDGRKEALERLLGEAQVMPPTDLMMSTEQLRALRDAGMEIGGHTMNHPILSVLKDDEAVDEIVRNRDHLTELLGYPPRFFAYPNGKPEADYTARNVRMVEEVGYEAAFTTSWGSIGAESSPYELPRFTPWDRTMGRFSLRVAQNFLRVQAPQLASMRMAA